MVAEIHRFDQPLALGRRRRTENGVRHIGAWRVVTLEVLLIAGGPIPTIVDGARSVEVKDIEGRSARRGIAAGVDLPHLEVGRPVAPASQGELIGHGAGSAVLRFSWHDRSISDADSSLPGIPQLAGRDADPFIDDRAGIAGIGAGIDIQAIDVRGASPPFGDAGTSVLQVMADGVFHRNDAGSAESGAIVVSIANKIRRIGAVLMEVRAHSETRIHLEVLVPQAVDEMAHLMRQKPADPDLRVATDLVEIDTVLEICEAVGSLVEELPIDVRPAGVNVESHLAKPVLSFGGEPKTVAGPLHHVAVAAL